MRRYRVRAGTTPRYSHGMRISRRSLVTGAVTITVAALLPQAAVAARPTVTVYKGAT